MNRCYFCKKLEDDCCKHWGVLNPFDDPELKDCSDIDLKTDQLNTTEIIEWLSNSRDLCWKVGEIRDGNLYSYIVEHLTRDPPKELRRLILLWFGE
jgi:hypothetical protein